jgi:hypothetical protein
MVTGDDARRPALTFQSSGSLRVAAVSQPWIGHDADELRRVAPLIDTGDPIVCCADCACGTGVPELAATRPAGAVAEPDLPRSAGEIG